jgi:hypothetical protein
MQSNEAAYPGPGFNLAMPAQVHTVAHNNFIFKHAIVSGVCANHNEIIITYFREAIGVHTWMDCYVLAKDVSVANDKSAYFPAATEGEHLRSASDYTEGKEMIIFADLDIAVNDHICIKDVAAVKRNTAANHTIRPNNNIGSQLSAFIDYGTGMYCSHFIPSVTKYRKS